jgi:hypothetical protein
MMYPLFHSTRGLMLLVVALMAVSPALSMADSYGPFLPPSTAKKQQEEALKAKQKPPEETEDKKGLGDKFKENLNSLFKPARPGASSENTPQANGTSKSTPSSRAPFIPEGAAPELDNVAPLVVEDPLPQMPANTRVDNPQNKMGLAYASNELKQVVQLKESGQFNTALSKSQALNTWLIDATETHIDLFQTLNRVPSARVQAAFEKKLGLEFAKLRDQNLLTLGELYIKAHREREAVRPLTQLIQSQSRSPMGYKAYLMLQEIGFTEELKLTAQ